MTDRNDYTTTIIYGKSAPPKKITSNPNTVVKETHQINKANGAVLERKIESGEMSLHPLIDKDVARSIQSARNLMKNGEKCVTQKDIATLSNQRGGKGVTQKDIADIEAGNIRLTTENKLKINAVKKALNMK
jgi:hypothetical protein